ncbi:MAG: glycosyl hydrolase 53 family protein [Christensenellales bacterium]
MSCGIKAWYKGMDVSSLEEVENGGGRFFDNGKEEDCIKILQSHDVNLIRLRLWNDPYSVSGEPYGGGANDFARTMRLAHRAKEAGMDWLLDFHYSDFWADPGKQFLPKAWLGMSGTELEQAVYRYTKKILKKLRREGLLPQIAAIGNEVTNGLLWPHGKKPAYAQIARLVSAGIQASKEVSRDIAVMIHLDNGGRNDLYCEWLDNYFSCGGKDFDIIGLSYYPFWHGTLDDLRHNMNDLAERYGKPLIVAETSMGFSTEDYRGGEERKTGRGMAATTRLAQRVPFPMTPEGQAAFLKALMESIYAVPKRLGRGLVYWEPAWLPVKETGWSTEVGCEYIKETGWGGNEWANQALFDYSGNALPALKVIRDF